MVRPCQRFRLKKREGATQGSATPTSAGCAGQGAMRPGRRRGGGGTLKRCQIDGINNGCSDTKFVYFCSVGAGDTADFVALLDESDLDVSFACAS